MRKIFVALIALLTFGVISAAPASAKWKCNGPSYACNGNVYHSAKSARKYKKRAYRAARSSGKKAYKKNRYAKQKYYGSSKKKYKKRYTKKSYGKKTRKYAKKSYGKKRYSGGGTLYGKASYYWQPQRVASGGWFNPNAMTAAHKSLPFGTRVRVTNKHNGRSVVVRINDRGPYIKGRIIDLSKAAAYKIGMQNAGVVPVTVTVLGRS